MDYKHGTWMTNKDDATTDGITSMYKIDMFRIYHIFPLKTFKIKTKDIFLYKKKIRDISSAYSILH